jgi:ankyrin repeat protein
MFDSEEYLESRTFPILHKIVLGLVGNNLRAQLQISTASIDNQDADGRTALSWAAGKGDVDAVETLLEFGANPNICSRLRQTALSWAAQGPLDRRCRVVKVLLEHGCNPNLPDHQHRIPLINGASAKDDPSFIKLMVDAGAEINWQDCHNRTALGYTAKMNRSGNARFLLSHGANPNIADYLGYTPLAEAVFQNHYDVLRILLEANSKIPNYKTAKGLTPLHIAAIYGDERTLNILSKADVRQLCPEDTDSNGQTARELFTQRDDVDDNLRNEFLDLLDAIMEDFVDTQELSCLDTQ